MLLDHRQLYVTKVHMGLSYIIAPIQYLVNAPVKAVDWIEATVTSHHHLMKENAHLKAQHLLLRGRLQRFMAIEKENQQLRALLQSIPPEEDRVLVGQLLAVDTDPYVHKVILNKGDIDSVFMGQAVLDASGVFGQIVQVGRSTSHLLLLTDTRSAIPVQNARNGIRAIAHGLGNAGLLKLANLPNTTGMQVGDVMVTSGFGQRFPAGYPVGTVIAVRHEPGDTFASVILAPLARLQSSRLVLLIWPGNKKQA